LSAGILASCPGVPPRWRFEPRDEALRLAIHELALAYPSDVIAITHLIHDSAGRNAHMFADAFRIRKD
jgi:hypothetical protein